MEASIGTLGKLVIWYSCKCRNNVCFSLTTQTNILHNLLRTLLLQHGTAVKSMMVRSSLGKWGRERCLVLLVVPAWCQTINKPNRSCCFCVNELQNEGRTCCSLKSNTSDSFTPPQVTWFTSSVKFIYRAGEDRWATFTARTTMILFWELTKLKLVIKPAICLMQYCNIVHDRLVLGVGILGSDFQLLTDQIWAIMYWINSKKYSVVDLHPIMTF